MSFNNFPANSTLKPEKFEYHVSDEKLGKFKQLLQLSELGPKTYENTTSDAYFGVKYDWIEKAKEHWQTNYDWRKTEARINSYNNYTVNLKDESGTEYNTHFIAHFSDKKDAIPIAFIHGWPGSILEFLGFIDVIKAKYPSPAELPYHVIVPSILGYGFSSNSTEKNMRMEDQAYVIDKLMVGLGFGDGYVAQGGDIGSFLSRMLASKWPSCKAAHLNMNLMFTPPDEKIPDDQINAVEQKALDERYNEFFTTGNAYAREHGTRPATIGFVLSASPLALLAWVAEKFQVWTDDDPTDDEILDSVTLYWFTQSFPRAIFPYRQLAEDIHKNPKWKIEAPKVFGYSFFPLDLGPVPKAWAKTTGNLVWFKQHSSGGHFASMEKPKELFEDVEDFIKQIWADAKKA